MLDPFERVRNFTGSLVALVTPFTSTGVIDYDALFTLVGWHERNGTDGLFFLGVAGEGTTFTDADFAEFCAVVLPRPRTIPFLIGCTGFHTGHTVERVRIAAENGADGAVLTLPPAMGPDQAQAARYFLDVADAAEIPLATFNNPARLLTDLDSSTLLEILRHPKIVLHKDGSPRTGQIGEVLAHRPQARLLADDSPAQDILLPALALGAFGIANAAGNLFPSEMARLAVPWSGSAVPDGFRDLDFRLIPLIKFMYSFRSPIGVKMMMNLVGLPAGHLRRPLDFPGEEHRAQGRELLRSFFGLRDVEEIAAKVGIG